MLENSAFILGYDAIRCPHIDLHTQMRKGAREGEKITLWQRHVSIDEAGTDNFAWQTDVSFGRHSQLLGHCMGRVASPLSRDAGQIRIGRAMAHEVLNDHWR